MDGHLLVSDLQSLVVETRRKNPEVKDASERALELLKDGVAAAVNDGRNVGALLEPMLLGMKTKNAKIIGVSIAALQRLISVKGVPTSSVPTVLQALTSVVNQGVDIQLRILQTLLATLTHCGEVHGDMLGNALLLCFKLQESKTSVVSSTAAATLRQAVMLVFDRVGGEDAQTSEPRSPPRSANLTAPTTPGTLTLSTEPPTELNLSPAALDAYSIFSDLCLLTSIASTAGGGVSSFLNLGGGNKEKPRMLKLSALNRTFGLELIESVLSGFENGVKKHPELLHLLQRALHPLLLKILAEKPPSFPSTLRVCRLVFLLLRSFADQLPHEAQIYLQILLRLALGEPADPASLGNDHKDVAPASGSSPMWLRVLALEIVRGICGDPTLLSSIWMRYDASSDVTTPRLYSSLISTLNRLATEKPALLGVGSQMHGLGVPSSSADGMYQNGSHASSGYLDIGLGMVASAASVGVSTMSAMIVSESAGLGAGSGMKLQLIEQHDKAEPPIVPDTYIYLLALHCLDAIADGFYSMVIPLFSDYVQQNQPGMTSPAALKVSDLPLDGRRQTLETVQGMASAGWPALLAALSFFIGTNLSDDPFADCLDAMQSFTIVCGVLGLETPRDAFLNTIGRFAVPPPVVSAMQSYHEAPTTPRNNGVLSVDGLGLGALGGLSAAAGPPTLSERNLACLKSTVRTAQYLAGSLGDAWHDVLEALQNANYIFVTRKANASRKSVTSPMIPSSPGKSRPSTTTDSALLVRPAAFDGLDVDTIQQSIDEVFDGTVELDDVSFRQFCSALCRLSSEMIGMDVENVFGGAAGDGREHTGSDDATSLDYTTEHLVAPSFRRRASGMNTNKTLRPGERSFALSKLRGVALRNLRRLTTLEASMGWTQVTQHLLAIARHSGAPSNIRVQAAEILSELLVAALQQVEEDAPEQSRLQDQVFNVLIKQVDRYPISNTISTDYDVRSLGLQSLNQILESSGHSLVVGWQTIFSMLNSVCITQQVESGPSHAARSFSMQSNSSEISLASTVGRVRPPPLSSSRGDANLVRVAFPSLTLICTDFLSSISSADLRLCTASLGFFGRQHDDVNITLAAIGLLWNVSDSIQIARRAASFHNCDPQDTAWLSLLGELLVLCSDSRLEVRNSAMQTLFRCIELYGGSLTENMWTDVIWKVILPLFEAIQAKSEAGTAETPVLNFTEEVGGEDEAAEKKRWDQSEMLVLSSTGSVFGTFLLSRIVLLPTFDEAFDALLQHIRRSFIEEARIVSTSALKALSRILLSVGLDREAAPAQITSALEKTWGSLATMGDKVIANANQSGFSGAEAPYTQDCLMAFVQALAGLHDLTGCTWDLERLQRLADILRGIMSYTRSPEYRPDVDSMPPSQSAVVDLLSSIHLSQPRTVSLVLKELTGYTTLAYMGAFEYADFSMGPGRKSTTKTVTFVALSKHCIPKVTDVFERHANEIAIYNDGTVERILGTYAIPIKLKYDCPPSAKFGDDPPLWKTASVNLVKVLRKVMATLSSNQDAIAIEHFAGIWTQIMEVISGALLADSTPLEDLSAAERTAEEAFAQPIFDLLKSSVVPDLGHVQVPEQVILRFSDTMRKASTLWQYEGGAVQGAQGTVAESISSSQERVANWCLEVLVAAVNAEDRDPSRERLARLALPALTRRFRETLERFLADCAIRGQMPFPRVRAEELVSVLQHLLALRLYPSSLTDPGAAGLKPALAASPIAHLFALYKPLLQLATTTYELPSIWISRPLSRPMNEVTGTASSKEELVEVHARVLAKRCLDVIGDEIGLGL